MTLPFTRRVRTRMAIITAITAALIIQNELAFAKVKDLCKTAGLEVYRPAKIAMIEWDLSLNDVLRPSEASQKYLVQSIDKKYNAVVYQNLHGTQFFPQIFSKKWQIYDSSDKVRVAQIIQYGFNGNLLNYYFWLPTFPMLSARNYSNSNMCAPPFIYTDVYNGMSTESSFVRGRYRKLKFE